MVKKLLNDYGMFLVLLLLCGLFSVLTLKQHTPTGEAAVAQLEDIINSRCEKSDIILAVGAANKDSARFAESL